MYYQQPSSQLNWGAGQNFQGANSMPNPVASMASGNKCFAVGNMHTPNWNVGYEKGLNAEESALSSVPDAAFLCTSDITRNLSKNQQKAVKKRQMESERLQEKEHLKRQRLKDWIVRDSSATEIEQDSETGTEDPIAMTECNEDHLIKSTEKNDGNNNKVNLKGRQRVRYRNFKNLSWYLYPWQACWACGCVKNKTHNECDAGITSDRMIRWVHYVNGLLWKICHIFEFRNLVCLLQYAQKEHVGKELSPHERNIMRYFERANGLKITDQYCIKPANCVAVLLCGTAILWFMGIMTEEERDELHVAEMRHHNGNVIPEGSPLGFSTINTTWPIAADAHLHMDRLFIRTGRRNYGESTCRLPNALHGIMDLVISSFSLPDSWPNAAVRDQLEQDPKLRLSIGWSPLWLGKPSPQQLKDFNDWLYMRDVVAAGEIGLDYNTCTTDKERKVQMDLLKQLLPIVRQSEQPLIIHCRQIVDDEKPKFSALDDCILTMKQFIPRTYPVFISGFNDNKQVYKRWVKHYPKVVFGISSVILDEEKMKEGMLLTVEVMDELRIMLETKAPIHTPKAYIQGELIAHHDLLVDIAEKVANIRYSHRAVVMDTALMTARAFFSVK